MTEDFVFPRGSAIIQAIKKVWPSVRRGVRWSIGDGATVRFWRDNWTHSPHPIINEALGPVPDDQLDWTVSDYVDDLGQWRWDLFSHLVPAGISLRIAAVLPPSRAAGPDKMYWGFSENGSFTTKSAYASLVSAFPAPAIDRTPWRIIWKWAGSQRVRQFLWLAAQDKLLTNVERRRRHISDSSTCTLCGRYDESTMHCLRDCTGARQVWRSLIPAHQQSEFFRLHLRDWLIQNLQNGLGIGHWSYRDSGRERLNLVRAVSGQEDLSGVVLEQPLRRVKLGFHLSFLNNCRHCLALAPKGRKKKEKKRKEEEAI
ncbi:Unknown protein [Striga hermonthica]|uniref:Reverse transcriptase zinc-binding domain-containing protein n=1 Tax=Striga hermonthica TaxID=68872 RepID=A0A9N7NZ97_STRHE|nr:Unknown protein [Striga hermonthica]